MYREQDEPPRPVIWVTPEQSRDFESGSENEDEITSGGRRRKKRQVLSCSECKRRKIKCDRNQPCGPCIKRGEGPKCEWSMPDKSQDFVPRAEFNKLEAKVAHLETMLKQLLTHGVREPDVDISPNPTLPASTASQSGVSHHAVVDQEPPRSERASIRLPPIADMVSMPDRNQRSMATHAHDGLHHRRFPSDASDPAYSVSIPAREQSASSPPYTAPALGPGAQYVARSSRSTESLAASTSSVPRSYSRDSPSQQEFPRDRDSRMVWQQSSQ